MNLSILNTVPSFVLRNSHHILTGLALIGIGASVALSVRADRIMQEWDIDEFKQLTKEQRIKLYVRIYAPPAVAVLATGACIVPAPRLRGNSQYVRPLSRVRSGSPRS